MGVPSPVAVRNLEKHYGAVAAVRDVGFAIGAGEVFGLLGPNGAGKTTTVESILGLVEPDAGTIKICGIDARSRPRAARRRIGAALQRTGLQDQITVREAVRLYGYLHQAMPDPAVLLDRFGLGDQADTRFGRLSEGQKQRLALALAFIGDPPVIVLDEPGAGVDVRMRRELHGHIREMREQGRAVLLTTHDMEEAAALCDRIAIIDRGRIVAQDSPQALIAGIEAAMRVVVRTAPVVAPDALEGIPGVEQPVCDADGIRFSTADPNRALGALIARLDALGATITRVAAGRATLEDVILTLTGAGAAD